MGKLIGWVALALFGCSSSGGASPNTGGSAGSAVASAGTANGGTANGGTANGGTANGGSSVAGAVNGVAGASNFVSTLVDAPSKNRGYLFADQHFQDATTTPGYSLSFDFVTGRAQWDGCTRRTLGSCWYYDCPVGSNPVGSANDTPLVGSAGSVLATTLAGMVDLVEMSPGRYQASADGRLWPAGGAISFSVSGGSGVPAFDIQIPAPASVSLTSLNGEAAPAMIKRSEGATLIWTSTAPGQAVFAIYAYSGQHPAALCSFDATANAGSMPAAVLEQVDPGSLYHYELRGDVEGDLTVGEWEISSTGFASDSSRFDRSRAIVLQ